TCLREETTRGTVFEDPSGGLTTAHEVVRSAPVWRTTRDRSHSHAGSTRSDVSWKSPPGRSRGRAGAPENTIIDLMTPPSPSHKRVSRNDESPRNAKTRAGSVASQHSTGSSTDMPSTARTSKDTNQFESCNICRCSMGPDSDVFPFKCGKIGSAISH
ncbi:unnamed protein product, partial [Ascophyllum nodosum]